MPTSINALYANCEYGHVGRIIDYGVSSGSDGNPFDQCASNVANEACKPPSNSAFVTALNSLIGGTNQVAVVDSANIFDPADATTASCINDLSQYFIQYTCEMNNDEQYVKYRQLCLYASIVLFVAAFYFFRIRHLIEKQNLEHMEWDLQTVTAGDYTIQKPITKEEYDDFLANHFGKTPLSIGAPLDPPGYAYKKFLKNQIEEIVTAAKIKFNAE